MSSMVWEGWDDCVPVLPAVSVTPVEVGLVEGCSCCGGGRRTTSGFSGCVGHTAQNT